MRNALEIPLDLAHTSLIVTSDNSGGIGSKADDLVHVPYKTVAYYSFRVAAMECIAAGGEPISVVLQNFCGHEPWNELVSGIQLGASQLGLYHMQITGSTESNFTLRQSAIGLLVIGKKTSEKKLVNFSQEAIELAVIGLPLVGNEVIEQAGDIVPLTVFQKISRLPDVFSWPVGSKGILSELQQMLPDLHITAEMVVTDVDICKSAGPATCFIAVFRQSQVEWIRKLAGDYFHSLEINVK
ncbi:hypothetical protein [Bacillus rubiinfantis]|uniref:hypothetical protein n=1 Tax=Bacillus rubiinfantis TaxID=1499680 RepID=UPI0005A8227D|nr:hypothetical protein [Bacillus rubiinfantis]